MRFNMPAPPSDGETEELLSDIISWLFALTENLNVVLSSISEDNLSPSLRGMIEKNAERNDTDDV